MSISISVSTIYLEWFIMHEELQLALTDVVSPERLGVILDAQRVLNDAGLTTADDELQLVLGLHDGISDYDLTVSRVAGVLMLALGNVLTDHGVECRDDTSMSIMVGIVHTLINFENYLIPESLVSIVESGMTNEEILASLVPLFTELDETETWECLVEVSDDSIRRMRVVANDLTSKMPPEAKDEVTHRDLRVKRINQILANTQQIHPRIVLELANRGVRMGQCPDLLVDLSLEELEMLDLEPLASELLGLTYYSNSNIEDIYTTLMYLVDELADDPDVRVRLREYAHTAYHDYADTLETQI